MTEAKDYSTADVYAGDITAPGLASTARNPVFTFRIVADAEPDSFTRVAGIFNIANIAPLWVHLRRDWLGRISISIDIELANATSADMISRKLEQLTCTNSVEWTVDDASVELSRNADN